MPESVSGVDAILDGLRDRATGWSCVPLADAVSAVEEAFAAGRAAAHPAGHIYEGNCPDEPFSDAAVDKIAWALMGDTLRMIDGLPPGARPAYRQGVRDRVRAALDVALPAAAVSPDERLREALERWLREYETHEEWETDSFDEGFMAAWRSIAALAAADQEAPDKPQEHTQECADAMFMHHAATGGDMECTCRAAADREAPDEPKETTT